MSKVYEEKAVSCLSELGLAVAQSRLDTACQQAAAQSWSYSHFLGYLLSAETEERKRKNVALNLQFAKFPVLKRLADFDFAAQPGLDRRLIDEVATGRFLYEGRNLIFLGPPGVGKTHLATALGVMACEMGHRVYFTNALEMARRLSLALEQNRLRTEMLKLIHPKLLILDEIGYLSLDKTQASLLFQAICSRYEKEQSIILTSASGLARATRPSVIGATSLRATPSWLLQRSTDCCTAARSSTSGATVTDSKRRDKRASDYKVYKIRVAARWWWNRRKRHVTLPLAMLEANSDAPAAKVQLTRRAPGRLPKAAAGGTCGAP